MVSPSYWCEPHPQEFDAHPASFSQMYQTKIYKGDQVFAVAVLLQTCVSLTFYICPAETV